MKTQLTLVLMAMLAMAACKNTSVPTPNPGATVRVSAPFASQTTDFAFETFKQVNAAEGVGKNIFISPLSLHIALGMILTGANGQTATEIQKTLKLDAQTLAEANQTYQTLLTNLPKADPAVTLTLANSVWYRQEFTVEKSFQDVLRDTFSAEVSAQDFGSPATKDKINAWASSKTNAKIPKVLDEIKRDDVLFLLNALYFKGNWKTKFDPTRTVDNPFTLATGGQKSVRMMRMNESIRRAFRPGYTAFELPYGSGDRFAMTVLLPNNPGTGSEKLTADALIQSFTAADWKQLQQDMIEGKLDIGLPKFTFSYAINVTDVLKKLGMPMAFTAQADFTKINTKGGLLLSFVKQNTFVAVDETGTEAAAVTTGGIGLTSLPQSYLCDHPFVVIIHEKTSGTVLFMGKIANPETNS